MELNSFRFLHDHSRTHKPLVAISACLTGAAVRYDGGDKFQPGIEWLRAEAELLPICPELDAGLGVPRPPVQLVAVDDDIRAIGRDDRNLDVTAALTATAQHHGATLRQLPLCGYLWKSRSPSCGLNSTPLFDSDGRQLGFDSGLQARAIAAAMPWLAMAEEETLQSEEQIRRFLLCSRLVFDCLHAGSATAIQVAEHYRALLNDLDERENKKLSEALLHNNLQAVVTVLISRTLTWPAATHRLND